MKHTLLSLLAATLLACSSALAADNFVRVSGTNLLGRDGKRIQLRGTNCGNYMVREPYMMKTSGNLDRDFKFLKMIADVCGQEKADEFERLWLDNNFAEADMQFLAEQGFNTLRVPMHYKYFTLPIEKEPVAGEQTWLDEGFTRIDSMVVWAERHSILLILDMHACPGGQSSGDICDYDSSKPSLWESEANRTKLVALWRKLAERYVDVKCIAAYDLINETNWTLPNSNKLLWDLHKDIIKAIREVDKNHIVILEGNNYANNYTGLPSTKLDSKQVIQYHRYGVYNTTSQVKGMTDMAIKYNCPIFLGEFGENSSSWMADAIRMYEEGAGFAAWTTWPMKKADLNSFLQVSRVSAYDNVVSQWQNGQRPSATTLWNAVKAWAEAQNIKKCSINRDFLDAVMRRPYDRTCLPYVETTMGDYVYAANYDLGPIGQAYWDTDDASYQYAGEDFTNWNRGWVYRSGGVDLYGSPNDSKNCGYYVGATADGEWLQYTIDNADETAKWTLQLRYAQNSGTSTIRVTVNNREVVPATKLTATGGYTTWSTKTFRNILVPQGKVAVRVYFDKGGANLNWLRFSGKTAATEEDLEVLKPVVNGNLLMNAACDYQGAWQTAAIGSINTTKVQWNMTTDTPSKGEGGALCIENAKDATSNIVLYQPVEVVAGHTYQADVAFRGTTGNDQFWVQAFMVTDEPMHYADKGLDEANTIGQLNSWKDASLAAYDGMMADKAKVGSNHTAGVMKWKAKTTGTAYFALKVGSQKAPFRVMLDDFTLTDLTALASVNDVEGEALPYSLDGRTLTLAPHARLYNLQGQALPAGQQQAGAYIVVSGNHSYKVVVK